MREEVTRTSKLKKLRVATDARKGLIMANKITEKVFLNIVLNAHISEDADTYATERLAKIEAANAKKAEKAAEKVAEEAPLYEALVAALTEDPQTSTDLFAQVSGISSVQKANYMLRKLASEGKCNRTELTIKGRKVNGFSAI